MTFSQLWNDVINLEPGIGAIALRLAFAMLVGALIGMEREFTHRPAGLRTHILVALGACVVSITGQMLFAQSGASDPARLSAQVITGVGFLGAGTIMKEGATVKGLTTAASVWAVACLGIAAGFGYYALVMVGMLFILITLTIFEMLQRKLFGTSTPEERYTLDTAQLTDALERINRAAQVHRVTVCDLTAEQTAEGYRISFRAHFDGRRSRKQQFFDELATAPESRKLHCTTV